LYVESQILEACRQEPILIESSIRRPLHRTAEALPQGVSLLVE
jgi:hypothetical protein